MYQPEFIARTPASRTSSFTKTLDKGTFLISLIGNLLADVDPLSGARRFESRFYDANRFHSIGPINQRRAPRFNRVKKCGEFRAERFFRREFELMHRAFLRFYFRTVTNMTILERFDFVLRHIVIADHGRILSDDRQFAHFSRQMVTGLDRRQNRSAAVAFVFQNNERFIIHLDGASEKIVHDRMHSSWRAPEQEAK